MELQRLLDLLLTSGRDEILTVLPQNSCVTTSRIFMDILEKQGYSCMPWQVHLYIPSKNLLLGRKPGEYNFLHNTHMVFSVGGYLVDPTIDQIGFEPQYFHFSGSFPVITTLKNGLMAMYFRDADSYPSAMEYDEDILKIIESINTLVALSDE